MTVYADTVISTNLLSGLPSIFALSGAARRQNTGAKSFDINCLPPKIGVIDNVAEVIVKNPQVNDNAEHILGSSYASHSHSIVAGGLPEMSYTTRLIPRISLMMRLETLPSKV